MYREDTLNSDTQQLLLVHLEMDEHKRRDAGASAERWVSLD